MSGSFFRWNLFFVLVIITTKLKHHSPEIFFLGFDDLVIPRPASNGSTFQPKGAVFKAHSPKLKGNEETRSPDSRPSSAKSDTSIMVGFIIRGIYKVLKSPKKS